MLVWKLWKNALGSILFALNASAISPEAFAKSSDRTIQCDLEAGSKMRIAGPCSFDKLGKDGSFRIQSQDGIVAEIKITGPKLANLSIAATGTEPRVFEQVKFFAGCWFGVENRLDKAMLCAWADGNRFYKGSLPREEPTYDGVPFGERIYMIAEIKSPSNLDTDYATIIAEPSIRAAKQRCLYLGENTTQITRACLARELEWAPRQTRLHADCTKGEFDVLWPDGLTETGRMKFLGMHGDTYYFEGLNNPTYRPNPHIATVTSYDMVEGAFKVLCPNTGKRHVLTAQEAQALEKLWEQ